MVKIFNCYQNNQCLGVMFFCGLFAAIPHADTRVHIRTHTRVRHAEGMRQHGASSTEAIA
jgi:hypothetical protein